MKKRITTILLTIIILAAVLVFFHLPMQVQDSLTVSTLTGETAALQMDLRYYTNWILPDYVTGAVTVDGVRYTDIYTRLRNSGLQLFPDGWWGSKGPYNTTFLRADCVDSLSAFQNKIWVVEFQFDDRIEAIHYFYQDDSSSDPIEFYGPAKTAEEAAEIAQIFGYQVP